MNDDATGSTSTAKRPTSQSKRSASSADDRQSGPALPAVAVTSRSIERRLAVMREVGQRRDDMSQATTSADSGSTAGGGEPQDGTQTSQGHSGNSAKRTSDSAVRWDTPANLMELVIQSNKLATMILNGEADIATARAYAEVTRTLASLIRSEIERRRFIGGEPIKFERN